MNIKDIGRNLPLEFILDTHIIIIGGVGLPERLYVNASSGRYAVWRLFESIYCSKLCVKRPFDAHPSSLLSLGQERTGSLGRGCRTRANWGVYNPP